MNSCTKCKYSIPSGEEVWLRNRKSNQRIPLCSQCAAELRRKRAEAEPAATDKSIPTPLSVMSKPSSKLSKTPIDGILLIMIMILVSAIVIGILLRYIGNNFILTPYIISFVSSFILYKGIRWGKLREPMIAGFLGLLFGLVVYGSFRITDYVIFRDEMRAMIMVNTVVEYGELDAEAANLVINEILYEGTGATGFIGFVLWQGRGEIPEGRASFQSGVNVDSFFTWFYWLFQAVTIIGMHIFSSISQAKRPFCEIHNRWYTDEKSVGGIVPTRLKKALQLLETQQFSKFSNTITTYIPTPGGEVLISRCPGCKQSSPLLIIKQRRRANRKIRTKVLREQFISLAQYNDIMRNIEIQLKAERMLR